MNAKVNMLDIYSVVGSLTPVRCKRPEDDVVLYGLLPT